MTDLRSKLRRAGLIRVIEDAHIGNGATRQYMLQFLTEHGREHNAATEVSSIAGLKAFSSPRGSVVFVRAENPEMEGKLKEISEQAKLRRETLASQAEPLAKRLLETSRKILHGLVYGEYDLDFHRLPDVLHVVRLASPNVKRTDLLKLVKRVRTDSRLKDHLTASVPKRELHVELRTLDRRSLKCRGEHILRNLHGKFEANERSKHLSNMPRQKR